MALGGLTVLGYHAIEKWAEGLKWKQFAEVAEQIRRDVERKLDEFIQAEEKRPYTEYRYYYVPDNITNTMQEVRLMRSPLGGQLEQGLAYGHFQIESDRSITTANDDIVQRDGANAYNFDVLAQAEANRRNVKLNLLPVLTAAAPVAGPGSSYADLNVTAEDSVASGEKAEAAAPSKLGKGVSQKEIEGKGIRVPTRKAGKNYPIESLQRQQGKAQILKQERAVMMENAAVNIAATEQQVVHPPATRARSTAEAEQAADQKQTEGEVLRRRQLSETRSDFETAQSAPAPQPVAKREGRSGTRVAEAAEQVQFYAKKATGTDKAVVDEPADMESRRQTRELLTEYLSGDSVRSDSYAISPAPIIAEDQSGTVQVMIEPFETIVVGSGYAENSIFGKQVFLVRDVQIEGRHIRQGFQLNEKKLIEEVKKSAATFMRKGMGFELPQTNNERRENESVTYTAVLDFGFGYLILYLKETIPEAIVKQASHLRNWYFSIVGIVFLAVTLALASLWRYARAQIKLAEKKDDFISAVSHELRTPLTSIRMYAEMLENNWVKSEDKLAEYYRNMRQESERLSRLIENVLDFSRIQKGRKKYTFSVGNLNECIAGVVEMMTPYATQNGFSIKAELEHLGHVAFDSDAIKQIVVNLLDNAVKYARNTADKTITVRTRSDSQYILIEVEDHGPGVPHRQRKKIFEEFYRLGSEATRETTGTGLGLALVKKFAQAHNGFVEILTAKPAGSIFRVGLAMQS
ncbi:MAG: sensor histidine kinase [Planctomycetota bacterium]